jgi:sphinganine-1-phosphate aldolase
MSNKTGKMSLPRLKCESSAGASFSGGGTESLFEAAKTARNQVRSKRGKPRGQYNIVAATTTHPTMEKAAVAMDIEVRRTPMDA